MAECSESKGLPSSSQVAALPHGSHHQIDPQHTAFLSFPRCFLQSPRIAQVHLARLSASFGQSHGIQHPFQFTTPSTHDPAQCQNLAATLQLSGCHALSLISSPPILLSEHVSCSLTFPPVQCSTVYNLGMRSFLQALSFEARSEGGYPPQSGWGSAVMSSPHLKV